MIVTLPLLMQPRRKQNALNQNSCLSDFCARARKRSTVLGDENADGTRTKNINPQKH